MKIDSINSTLLDLVLSNKPMSSYLDSLSRGRSETPHSWLYESEQSQSTLKKWIPLMETANNNSSFGEEFTSFDLSQVKKFGPQGEVPPVQSPEAQEVIEPLFSPTDYDNELALSNYFERASEFAKVAFGSRLKTKRPLSFKSVVDDMSARDTLSTNSGFPRFTRRSTVYELEIQDAETERAYDYPAIILFRQYNGKLRPVWMFPMSQNLIEFTYSQVIQDALLRSPTEWIRAYLSPWLGFENVKQTLTSQWPSESQIVGGDTTKMDAHMRPAQIRLVYEIVKWLFQESYWPNLHRCLIHICEIPLLFSKTEQYVGIHGLASGSGWTQLTETVLQLFMSWNANTYGQGIGDDFYWLTDMNADQLVDYLGQLGLPANASKQTVSTDALMFLQRYFRHSFFSRNDKTCLGAYYPTTRALNSLLNPEKFHNPKDWNSDMFCIRNYMILENCVDNPCFEVFVRFVVQGHRDMIPFAKKSSSELDSIQSESRTVPGLNPSYNQEKRFKPLSSFESIIIASRL